MSAPVHRRFASVALILAFGVVIWWCLGTADDSVARTSSPQPGFEASAPDNPTSAPLPGSGGRVSAGSKSSATRTYRVHAIVHHSDSAGSEDAPVRATWRLRLDHLSTPEAPSTQFAISNGTGSIEAQLGDRLEVLEVRVSGRLAAPRVSQILLGEEQDVTVEADWPALGLVRVVDAESRLDLTAVRVIAGSSSDSETTVPPLSVQRGSPSSTSNSPLRLPLEASHTTYWLGAEGYAWRSIRFGESSGQPVYALEQGGALRVDVTGESDGRTSFALQLERAVDGAPWTERVAEEALEPDRPLQWSGLPAGELTARVVALAPNAADTVVAEAVLTILAGTTSTWTIDLGSVWRASELGECELTVVLERPSDVNALVARIETLDSDPVHVLNFPLNRMIRRDDGALRWYSGSVPKGRRRISITPSVQTELLVQPGSTARVTLSVPALPSVHLWSFARDETEAVQPRMLLWRSSDAATHRAWTQAAVRRVDGGCEFEVPVFGPIEISVHVEGFLTEIVPLEVLPGSNHIAVNLRRLDAREIIVQLRSGAEDVPAPTETWQSTKVFDATREQALVTLMVVDGPNALNYAADGATAVLVVNGAGTYTVQLGRIPGFRTPAARSVTVEDARAELVFELARE